MSFCYFHQGSKQHWQREGTQKSEGGGQGPSSSTEGRDRNSERTSTGGTDEKGKYVKENVANESVQAQEQRRQDTSNRRQKDNRDTEKARVNVGSREFVRGGRGRLRGSARGRGRSGHHDAYGSASHGEVESANQSGSADNDNNARLSSTPNNTTKTNGSEQKRSRDGRTDGQQSSTGDRRSSHEASVGGQQMTKVDAEDRRNARGTGQLPSDDRGSKHSNSGNRDTGRWGNVPALTSRRRVEFYDSRNRGQRMNQSDARAHTANRPQQQQQQASSAPAKDGADAEKNAAASSLEVAGVSSNKRSDAPANEPTSQRKPGEQFMLDYFCLV